MIFKNFGQKEPNFGQKNTYEFFKNLKKEKNFMAVKSPKCFGCFGCEKSCTG